MPEKRMFTKKITESDAFLDMPLSSQALYFHLNMNADDDGFVNNPKRIIRQIGASDEDFNNLKDKKFVLTFDSGVMVVKHWRMHNTLQNDRYHPTDYQEEYALLEVKKNKSYTWKQFGNNLETNWKQNITKHNITKHRDEDIQQIDRLREAFGEEVINNCEKALRCYVHDCDDLMELASRYDTIRDLDAYVYTMMEKKGQA